MHIHCGDMIFEFHSVFIFKALICNTHIVWTSLLNFTINFFPIYSFSMHIHCGNMIVEFHSFFIFKAFICNTHIAWTSLLNFILNFFSRYSFLYTYIMGT